MACGHHQRVQGGRLGAAASGWGGADYEASGVPRARRRQKRVWIAIDLGR
jgi:hypothetical protein